MDGKTKKPIRPFWRVFQAFPVVLVSIPLLVACSDGGSGSGGGSNNNDNPSSAAYYSYFKASNTGGNDLFGNSVSLSGDGNTLAVGAFREDGNATGIDGDQTNDLSADSGAVYVFGYDGGTWRQQAYVKASNTGGGDFFGISVSLNADGNTLAVGARREDGNATGIGGDQTNDLSADSGAVYVFNRSGDTWSQRAYVKASNTGTGDEFGGSLSLSGDGNTLATGASLEDGNATGINGESDGFLSDSGAVYVGSAGP